ncbi:Hachiman antiphage defense system protein HamA [Specibacter cremeus]|uniref:Hachiman antiphage defense system protein HamA n=1 Tax=Specibacter cremeus TaxID=1629051 RepID=UPI0013DE0569|nr:Hachiman antiphage defense system protein HamA [Specibacter cremeus]
MKQVPGLASADGDAIEVWAIAVPEDAAVLSSWAAQFRQTYCLDEEIDELRDGTGLSRRDYLLQFVFPAENGGTGPATRSGDFAELLISDYVEHILGFWVPRWKYADKTNPNESIKGVDVVGFLLNDPTQPQPSDQLIAFEVKARLTPTGNGNRLQDAIKDSGLDYTRLGYTLNKAKRLLRTRGNPRGMKGVARFQNKADRPFELLFGAAAVLNDAIYNTDMIQASTAAGHPYQSDLQLLVIHGDDLMRLTHALYRRAADEA